MADDALPDDDPNESPEDFVRKRFDVLEKTSGRVWDYGDVKSSRVVGQLMDADRRVQVVAIREAVDRHANVAERLRTAQGGEMTEPEAYNLRHAKEYPKAAIVVADQMFRRKLPFTEEDFTYLVDRTACVPLVSSFSTIFLAKLVKKLETFVEEQEPGGELVEALERLGSSLTGVSSADDQKLRARVAVLVSTATDGPQVLPILPGEAWSDAVLADLEDVDGKPRAAWVQLLGHAGTASAGKPSKKWLKQARDLVEAIGPTSFAEKMATWLPLVDKPRTAPIPEQEYGWLAEFADRLILEPHQDILKGLAWCASLSDDPAVARALCTLAISSYKKLPGIGPRFVRVGNAAVWALGAIPGIDAVGQLALLKVKVKFGTAQKGIEKALTAAAEREGLPRDELEEMAVPAYGLTEVGRLTEELGEFTAELTVTGTSTTNLAWIKPDGKRQKSVPAAVKKDHADDLKELKAAAKDVQKMLPAQSERIDNLFLAERSWSLETWRERYLDHPLVGTLARRLVWCFTDGDGLERSGVFHEDRLVDADGDAIDTDGETTVAIWHPIDRAVEDVLAWRNWFTEHEVRQPFKQAHREVYLLTDAERNTNVYSNRFAAHIVKQHQFHALCQARGWRDKLRLMVDDEFPPPSKELPRFGLRAEFWVEGAGDDYGTDTTDVGTFLYLATDQVRFYPIESAEHSAHSHGGGYGRAWNTTGPDEPLPLDQIPPLAFSEIMRDVDLFVGVSSVGNDPNWIDGASDGRYADYWNSYSFGELGATAETRKAVLEKLVPRLAIADRCTFADRFLVVRGDIRTYKIHLGSGNILMEPNDEYLCIVPKSGTAKQDKVFLPFEGDRTLSIVLSKAMLLADDTKIDDPTIVSQITKS